MSAKPSPWTPYRRGKRRLWLGFALYLPFFIVADRVLDALGAPDGAIVWGAAAWLALWMLNGVRLGRFRCPRCAQRFFYPRRFSANLLATRCCHCGTRPP